MASASLTIPEPCVTTKEKYLVEINKSMYDYTINSSMKKEHEELIGERFNVYNVVSMSFRSIIYHALDNVTKKRVVLKTNLNEAYYNSLKSEYDILLTLDHPNIIKPLWFNDKKPYCIICFDYYDKGDLFSYVSKGYFYNNEEQIKIFALKMIHLMQYLHHKKVMHRDIKSENILVKDLSSMDFVLIDFEFSIVADDAHGVAGTPTYCSIEMIENKPYTHKTDIWSFGVILHIMTEIALPFDIHNNVLVRYKHRPDSKVSRELKAITNSIFTIEKNRVTLEEILTSKWMESISEEMKVNRYISDSSKTFHL
jgi:serine/threonine protein kinase